jgi:hypothetical protein
MIILDATTKSLQFKLAGNITTNALPFAASYVDTTGTATTPAEQDGASNNTTAVTVVSAPAASTQRLVKSIVIQNADTVAATVTIIYNNNSTLRNIFVATLAVGDQLIYEDGTGWACLDKNGNLKTSGGGGGTPGGSSGQVQYNNAGAFGGLANGQLPATATNDNATAGNIGEYVSSFVGSGTPVSLVSNTSKDVTSISLTAGDWDVEGTVLINLAGTTTCSNVQAGISQTSNTMSDASAGMYSNIRATFATGTAPMVSLPVGPGRIRLSATTTIYLEALAVFGVSTATANGFIGARRAR